MRQQPAAEAVPWAASHEGTAGHRELHHGLPLGDTMRGGSARTVTVAVWLLASVAAPAAAQTGQRDVFVTVLDTDGTPITGLTRDYFAVREDGRDRDIVGVAPLSTPMHVALLVDTSLGTAIAADAYRTAVTDFVGRTAGTHHVALYSFGERAQRVVPFTQDAPRLKEAAAGLFARSAGGSYLLDAVDLAVNDMEGLRLERPLIVAITTESVEASAKSAGSVIKRLVARSITLHVVVLASATGSDVRATGGQRMDNDIIRRRQNLEAMMVLGEGDRERGQLLRQGVPATGGSLQRVSNLLALGPSLFRLASEFAASYRLTFARPPSDRPSKDLQVGIMLEGVTVRASAAPTYPK
jgi:VWFA-related protein